MNTPKRKANAYGRNKKTIQAYRSDADIIPQPIYTLLAAGRENGEGGRGQIGREKR